MSTSTPNVTEAVTPEVAAFAAERGLTPYLVPVLELTDRVFPGRRTAVFVEADMEIADLRYIAIGVDVTGLSLEQLRDTRNLWRDGLFACCPSTHVCDFVLAREASAVNGRDFLALARTLATAGTEAAWRSATSRAYYAAFHAAREMLHGLGFTVPPSEKAHAYLWMRLTNCGDASTEHAGWDLQDLRRDRGFADYQLQRPFTQKLAQDSVQFAEGIIQALDFAAAGPNRQPITGAIKIYERDVLQNVTWRP